MAEISSTGEVYITRPGTSKNRPKARIVMVSHPKYWRSLIASTQYQAVMLAGQRAIIANRIGQRAIGSTADSIRLWNASLRPLTLYSVNHEIDFVLAPDA